jgi:hypothetical protein
MHHRSLAVKIGFAVLTLVGLLGAAAAVLKHERQVYLRGAVPAGEARQRHSKSYVMEFTELLNGIQLAREWQVSFTEAQINSFFEEDFKHSGLAKQLLPHGISEPRVVVEENRLRLGFRYGLDFWSTVVTIDLRVWLAPKEPNVVAVEFQGVHAGALPISPQSLIDQVKRFAERSKLEVSWYRFNGNPVALLRFPGDQPRPTTQVRQLLLTPGRLIIVGGPVGVQRQTAAAEPNGKG